MTPNVELIDTEPLDGQVICDFLREFGSSWNQLSVLPTVGSTNAELARDVSAIQTGNPKILIAEEQTSGQGRLGRTWSTAEGKGIALSVGVDASDVEQEATALPLIVGLAVIRALSTLGVSATLKWPNDVVFQTTDDSVRKCGGILVQRVANVYVIGIGINVTHQMQELPTEVSTSLLLEGYAISRNELTARIINQVELAVGNSDDWLSDYMSICSSLNRDLVVHQLNGDQLVGMATSISPSGALVLLTVSGNIEVTIGDVEHATISC